ncbi:FxsB family cyclophane-forming radical SAM/SPASM peptide maturase [Streptacidiphilus rugosus]|uniref:FxsB family cyclophane-forming radical SAM/SPASM peptide maturase n=1 Tax=Streptacidiphilus rugosus TaxID=405783 RepID=UPI00068A377A|nr:FxsB family cyclophane-forming radical SAM/SPASM peptide maturase [Streptacidiphilus rugosus]
MTDDQKAPAFRQFVLKVHSRCDLACDHCYVYEHADTSWQGRPKAAAEDVLRQTAVRIAEHARAHGLDTVHVVLHGGEPLLAGPVRLRRAAQELTDALRGVCRLDLRIHTNGVTLNERFLDLFDEFRIRVGISLDGDRSANDLHRRYADGRSSHDRVVRAVNLLRQPRWRHLYAGLLCTIDVRNDPVAVYDALVALDPPRIDFLLPHATWDEPPLRPHGPASTPYADWLWRIYERWTAQGRPVPVRMFDSVHRTLRGESSLTESLGLAPADLVVVETDGTLEQADSLKTAFDGAAATGFDVFDHDFDTAARHPGMMDRRNGLAGLCAQCRACPVVESCGAGLYAHRYRSADGGVHSAEGGFDNPSVFCPDLLSLITRIHDTAAAPPALMAAPSAPSKEHSGMPEGLLTDDQFDELAGGHGGAAAVGALRDAQLELNRALLDAVGGLWAEAPDAGPFADVYDLIGRLDQSAPQALDAAVEHPFTRSWAVAALRGADEGPERFDGLVEVAAAAALFAGWEERLRLPVGERGELRLPGHGVVTCLQPGTALLTTGPGPRFSVASGGERIEVELDRPCGADPRWHPVHTVGSVVGGWQLRLDDTDPQRRAHNWRPADPMDQAEADRWQAELEGAWGLVDATLPAYAPGLRAGLSAVVPLQRDPSAGRGVSGAARDVFGAVGIARPGSSETMALLMIHEFQHVKLGAIFDVEDLFDPHHTDLYHAPWRPDPRPFEGLFQGTYAHIAVVEFWLSRWRATGDEHAREEFTRWLDHTHQAIGTMTGSGALTARGERFVAGMRATVEPWLGECAAVSAVGGDRA